MAFPPMTPPPLNMSEDENAEDEDDIEDPYHNIHSEDEDDTADPTNSFQANKKEPSNARDSTFIIAIL